MSAFLLSADFLTWQKAGSRSGKSLKRWPPILVAFGLPPEGRIAHHIRHRAAKPDAQPIATAWQHPLPRCRRSRRCFLRKRGRAATQQTKSDGDALQEHRTSRTFVPRSNDFARSFVTCSQWRSHLLPSQPAQSRRWRRVVPGELDTRSKQHGHLGAARSPRPHSPIPGPK